MPRQERGITPPEKLPPRPLAHHLALSVYWLSNTLLWGALFHLALQTRLGDWHGQNTVGYYFAILGFVGGIVGTAAQIVAGAFSDRSQSRWGRRRPFLAAGSMLGIAMLMLMGAAKSFWPFAGALILVQLFTNIALGPFTALLPDTVNPREHGKASGFMGVARLLGDTGGLVLSAQLLSASSLGENATHAAVTAFHAHGMLVLCSIMAVFMGVTAVFTCLVIRERPLGNRPDASVKDIIANSFNVDIRGNADFFWLSVSRAVTNIGFYMFLEVMPFFMRYTLHMPDPESATRLVMLPAIGAAVLSSIPSGMLSDRIGRRRLIFAAQFLMAGGALAFVLAPSMKVALLAGIPAGLAYGVFTAVEWSLACNLLPEGESARYLGVWNASAVVPQIAGFVIAGVIGSAVSTYRPGLGWRADFFVAVLFCLAGAYFLKHVRERRAT